MTYLNCALVFVCMAALSMFAHLNLPDTEQLPLLWQRGSSQIAEAPRMLALFLLPGLSAIVLSALSALPRGRHGAQSIVFVALAFLIAHGAYIWLLWNRMAA